MGVRTAKIEFWVYQVFSFLSLLVFVAFAVLAMMVFIYSGAKDDDTWGGAAVMAVFVILGLLAFYKWGKVFVDRYKKLQNLKSSLPRDTTSFDMKI